jgi:hypothetical protein
MEPLKKLIDEFKTQLKKGIIQKAYKGLMEYILGLRTGFADEFPGYSVSGTLYHGYMDMTYFALFPPTLKQRKLKIAIVFSYDTFRFEIWLSAINKHIQAKYLKLFQESGLKDYRIVPTVDGYDSIVEHVLAKDPDFDDPDGLTRQIMRGTRRFIEDIEKILSRKD